MRQLRFSGAVFLLWVLALYNAEQIHHTLVLSPVVVGWAVALAAAIVCIPGLHKRPLFWLLLLAGVPMVIAQVYLVRSGVSLDIPLSLTELTAVAVTLILARQVARSHQALRDSLAGIVLGHFGERALPFESGQAEIYREIRRARLHDRPAALLVVAPANAGSPAVGDRVTAEIARAMSRDYLNARLAGMLASAMTGCETITQRDGRFIVLLPETDREAAAKIVDTLRAVARAELDLELKFGYSLFPEEEVSFVGLLERAQQKAGVSRDQADGSTTEGTATAWDDSGYADAAGDSRQRQATIE